MRNQNPPPLEIDVEEPCEVGIIEIFISKKHYKQINEMMEQLRRENKKPPAAPTAP